MSKYMSDMYRVEIVYSDGSEINFDVRPIGADFEVNAMMSMLTRGLCLSSNCYKATCYNCKGEIEYRYVP